MTGRLGVLAVAIFAAAICGTSASAQTPLSESPITPGFWSFPRKPAAPSDAAAACRAHLEIRFADGHFLGLRTQKRDMGLLQREVETVGRCSFDRDKQVDICEIKNIHSDGSILAGVLTIKYTLDPKAAAKTNSKTDSKAELQERAEAGYQEDRENPGDTENDHRFSGRQCALRGVSSPVCGRCCVDDSERDHAT